MPPIMLAANEVVAVILYLVLLVPCAWLVSALYLAIRRDLADLRRRD